MDNKLIEEYVEAAINYGESIEKGNSKEANKNATKMHEIRNKIKQVENYHNWFIPLLNHENDYVKLYSAYLLLQVVPEKAEIVLVELSKKRKLLGFEAKMTLKEWRKGNLKFKW